MSGNQALSRKHFQAKRTQQNTNKWRHNKRGRRTDTWHVILQGRRAGREKRVSTTRLMTHRITSQDAKVTTESLCEWNEWIPAGWRRMWVPQFEYSVEYWVPLGGTPPPHSCLCILNIWHERKGTGWGRLRLRLRFYTPPLSATTPSRPEYRKGCLCCGIPMHSERERKRGGRVSRRGRVR